MKYVIVALTGGMIGWVLGASGISLVNPWLLLIVTSIVFVAILIWVVVTIAPRWPG